MEKRLLEIACFNYGSALIAQFSGAHRIELCANYWEGGISPHLEMIAEVRERLKISMHVIIRPRGGDYIYSSYEIKEMIQTIQFCKEHKVDGVVIGVLNEDLQVDTEVCSELLSHVGKMSVTFHRAIDHCEDLDNAFKDLIDLGIDRVLTSGGSSNAFNGLSELKRLQETYGNKIIIMPGGGIRATNIKQLLQTQCKEFHSAALTNNTVTANATEIKKLLRQL